MILFSVKIKFAVGVTVINVLSSTQSKVDLFVKLNYPDAISHCNTVIFNFNEQLHVIGSMKKHNAVDVLRCKAPVK